MRRSTPHLVAELVDDLRAVRPLSMGRGLMLAGISLGATMTVVALPLGLRDDMAAGHFDPIVLLATGLFLLLGIAASVTVIGMSRPHVGSEHSGWKWAAAMAALLPVTAIALAMVNGPHVLDHAMPSSGLECVMAGGLLSLISAGALILWLRRGAPTSPEQAGLLTGVAAGSFGIFAYSFHCGASNIYHIGLWHSMTVVVAAAIGRMVVPRLLRW